MYRECLIGADDVLTILAAVLFICFLGALAAADRNGHSARKYRRLFNEAQEKNRRLRREISWFSPSFGVENHRPDQDEDGSRLA